jgi:hypothetical protein
MSTTTPDMTRRDRALVNPYDTATSSATRFALELVAWSAGPLAVYRFAESVLLAGVTLAGLVSAPALFNTPGDKHVPPPIVTPGPVRLTLEMGLWSVAVVSAAVVWTTPIAVAVAGLAIVATIAGAPRARWLLSGAPMPVA